MSRNLGQPCGMCGGRGGVHTPRCSLYSPPVTAAPGPQQPDELELCARALWSTEHDIPWELSITQDWYRQRAREALAAQAALPLLLSRPAEPLTHPDEGRRELERATSNWLLSRYGHYMAGQPDELAVGFITDARQLIATLFPAAPSAQPDERPCDCTTPLPAGSLFYAGSHHQPGCVFYHAPAPAQPVRDTEEGRR